MISTVTKTLAMVPREMRWRWVLLPPIAVITGAFEAGGAASVFALITAISQPERIADLPVVGGLVPYLPWKSPDGVVLSLTALVAFYHLLKNVFLGGAQYFRQRIIAQSTAAVATRMLGAYLAAPYPFHFHRSSAELMRNLNVAPFLGEVLSSASALTSEILVILGVSAVLLRTAPSVTLAAGLILGLLMATALRIVSGAVKRTGARQHELNRSLLRSLQNALGGVKETKAAGREDFFRRDFERHQAEMVAANRVLSTLNALPPLVIETVFVCGSLLVIALVTIGGRTGPESLPVLALFGYGAFRIVPAANRIAWRLTEVRARAAPVAGLYDDFVLLGEPPRSAPAGGGTGVGLRQSLELDRVSYTYPGAETAALRDFSTVIHRGEAIGIVGPTGAGKSTLVDVVLGLLEPTSGVVRVDGVDLATCHAEWKRSIGYVPQQIFLLDDSVRHNVAYALDEVDDERVRTALGRARVDTVVAALPDGLDARVGERGLRLSGGERQRLGIARALYHDPAVLVLDEPTSSLDRLTEAEIVRTVAEMRGERTVLIVSHRLAAVRQCDRLLFLVDGALADSGPFDELVARNPAFADLVRGSTARDDATAEPPPSAAKPPEH
jgi:ATP-binding cassette subfamily C protein